jgi:hypothetical protein
MKKVEVKVRGIMSFTPLSTRFPKITVDFCEGISYLKYKEKRS